MQSTSRKKGGRKVKSNPKKHRHVFRLTEAENERLLNLFKSSGMTNKASFITSMLLDKQLKTVKVDVAALQYHATLTNLSIQFRRVEVNYNQIVKLCNQHFSEERAKQFIPKLEEHTKELSKLCFHIINSLWSLSKNTLKPIYRL